MIAHLRASAGHQLHLLNLGSVSATRVPSVDGALPQHGGCTRGAPHFLKTSNEKRSCHPSILKTSCRTWEWNPCPSLPAHTRQPPHQGRAAVFCQCPKCETRQRPPLWAFSSVRNGQPAAPGQSREWPSCLRPPFSPGSHLCSEFPSQRGRLWAACFFSITSLAI